MTQMHDLVEERKHSHGCQMPYSCERTRFKNCYGLYPGWVYAVAVLLGIAVLATGITVSVIEGDERRCARVGNQAGLEVKYSGGTYFSRDCYVRFNGDWVPYDKWVNITIPGDVR